MNGEIALSDSNFTHIIDNEFTENMRGVNAAIIYLERTPFFELTGNTFTNNVNLYLTGQVSSLSDFVTKATGLSGVYSLGKFDYLHNDAVRMLPLLFSNLGLSVIIENNKADSNAVSAG